MAKKEKKDPSKYITGGIIYEDGTIESFDEISKRKRKIKGKKVYGDVDTDKLIETKKRF